MDARKFLSSLEDMIKHQLSMEYHDVEDAEHVYANMTVRQFLHMLSYMMEDCK